MAFTSDSVAVFLAVLDHGSFSAAARALGRVPSAVSMAMANLEAELDLLLFERGGREPRPSAAALALEPLARQIAQQLRQLKAHAQSLHQGLESRLALAVAPELLATHWSEALAVLATEHPGLEVEVLVAPQADALRLLHQGSVQLALVFERPSLDGREDFQEVGSETLVAVMSPAHPLLAGGPRALRSELVIQTRQIVVAGRDQAPSDPRIVLARQHWRTDNHQAALNLVLAGLGWAYLPRAFVAPQVAAGTLVEVAFENLSNDLRLWVDLVWSRERPLGLGARRLVELITRQG